MTQQYPPYWETPDKTRTSPWVWVVVILGVLVLALLAVAVVLYLVLGTGGPTPTPTTSPATPSVTQDDAERVCYQAFNVEFKTRDAAREDQSVLGTITSITVLDSRLIDNYYEVNGSVHYDLTTDGTTVSDTLELTCTAVGGTDGSISTSVANRQ